MLEVTEQQVRDVLRSTMHSKEELAIMVIMELLNGDFTIEELRQEIEHENTRAKRSAASSA